MSSEIETATEERPLAGLLSLFTALRRRFGIVLVCAVLVPAAAVSYALHQQKIYTAKASLLFRDPQFDQQLLGGNAFQPTQDPAVEQATNLQLVALPVLATDTSAHLHGRLTPTEVSNDVSVSGNGQANISTIAASNPDPQLAATLANVYAQQFVAFRRNADRAKIESAITLIHGEIAALRSNGAANLQRQTLLRNVNQLHVLAALQTGNAEVVQTASAPTSPSSPKPTLDGALGLVFGLLLGIGLALLLDRLDRRLKDPEQIAQAFGRSVLATIPESGSLARRNRRQQQEIAERDRRLGASSGLDRLRPVDAESFRMLRVSLRYFNVDHQVRSVVITSASQADGKSTVAMNLAMAAGEAGTKTLLLEADLRHPTIAQELGLQAKSGLSLVLAGESDLASAITQIRLIRAEQTGGVRPQVPGESDSADSADDYRTLDVVVAGPVPPNPSDLIDSRRMREVLREVEQAYELVVVDTPPTSVVSDAVPLVKEVSGVVIVARVGQTTRESATRLRNQLDHLGAHVFGVVVNAIGQAGAGYGYYGEGASSYFSTEKARPSANGAEASSATEAEEALAERQSGD
jgi:polysaccharide biosynthesis transport protein